MVFNPKVDNFTSLQIQGLWEKFSLTPGSNITVVAASNSATSRPAIFKLDKQVAPILNLVVILEMGAVKDLVWENSCNNY